jgi:hypothetical protein
VTPRPAPITKWIIGICPSQKGSAMLAFDEQTLVSLGKAQVQALFQRQTNPKTLLDDRDLVPLLEAVLSAFETIELSLASIEAPWPQAYSEYDRLCRQDAPSFSFDENRALMQRYLTGPRRATPARNKRHLR